MVDCQRAHAAKSFAVCILNFPFFKARLAIVFNDLDLIILREKFYERHMPIVRVCMRGLCFTFQPKMGGITFYKSVLDLTVDVSRD